MNDKELIAEATAHIDNTLHGIGTDESSVRAAWARGEGSDDRFSLLVRLRDRLANALEVRQPSEEGEYILRLIETIKQTGGSVEVSGVKIMPCDEFGRTAAVPDAATEELERAHDLIDLREFEIDNLHELISELRTERDAAVAAIERLNARHRKIQASAVTGDCAIEECEHEDECPTEVFEVCAACWNLCESADPYFGERGIAPVLWPCEIATALDGAPEPETPELFPGTNAALDRLTVRKAAPAEAFCIEHGNFHAVELGDPTCEFEDGFGEPVEGEKP